MVAVPVDPFVVGDAGFFVGGPQFHRPKQRAQVFVNPVLRAGDGFFRVVLELMPNADGRVAAGGRAQGAEAFVVPQVFGNHVVVTLRTHGTQDHAAVGVITDGRADVGVAGDEVHHGAHFRLAGGVGACAKLLKLLPPTGGEVAVQVQAFGVGVDVYGEAVVLLDAAFRHQAEVLAAKLAGLARHHQAGIAGVFLVRAVRIRYAHEEHATVAVHVFDRQAFDRRFLERVAPRAGADVARLVGQRQLGPVGVQARADVDHAGVEQVGDLRINAVLAHQLIQVIQAGGAGGEFGRVDVAVDPKRGLFSVGAGVDVGDAEQPNVTALKAFADAVQLDQIGPRSGVGLQELRLFVVSVENVETRGGQHRWQGGHEINALSKRGD